MEAQELKERSTVLFVDDEPHLIEAMRNSLRKEPYRILIANSAKEALETLENNEVHVVVSDEQMPGMSGSELLSAVRQRFPDTVRIILTGQASLDAAIRAINGGEIYRFLTKPCAPADVAQTLRQALQLRELTERSVRLLHAAKKHRTVVEELERAHPGITQVTRGQSGVVVIDEELDQDHDVESLIRQLDQELTLQGL